MISPTDSLVSARKSLSFLSTTSSSSKKKEEIYEQECLIEKISDLTTNLHEFESLISPHTQGSALKNRTKLADEKLIILIQTKNMLLEKTEKDLFSRACIEYLSKKIERHARNLPKDKKQQLPFSPQNSMITFSGLSLKERNQIKFLVNFKYDE